MNFQIGQKVVCVHNKDFKFSIPTTDTPLGIKEGEIYTVRDVCYCSKCGNQNINIGGKSTSDNVLCRYDNNKTPNRGLRWLCASRFVPLEEYEASEKMVEELLEPIKEKV